MLDALRFVASAVAKKDFVPELTHFKIKDGRVTGFNGQISLSSPIDVGLDIQPAAVSLIAAIRACPDTITLNMTAAGRLAVRSGAFKAFIPCLPDEPTHFVAPEGDTVELGENFLAGIKAVAPVMGVDASRPWAMGIKLAGASLVATNNVMVIEYWHGQEIPLDVVIPAAAINELLRIDEAPTRVQVTESSISFWFEGDRWMRSQILLGGSWPIERLNQIMSGDEGNQQALPVELKEQVETLKPFLGDKTTCFVTSEGISTAQIEGAEGAAIAIPLAGVTEMQAYSYRQLVLLAEVAKTIDWTNYPSPCMFRNERVRGAIIGQRLPNGKLALAAG